MICLIIRAKNGGVDLQILKRIPKSELKTFRVFILIEILLLISYPFFYTQPYSPKGQILFFVASFINLLITVILLFLLHKITNAILSGKGVAFSSDAGLYNAFIYAPIGIALIDLDGSYLKINPAYAKLIGCSEEEILRMNFRGTLLRDDQAFQDKIQELFHHRAPLVNLEISKTDQNGNPQWVFMTASLARDRQEHPLYLVVQVIDVTDSKNAERQIRSLNEELRQHTTELEAANQELEAFSYSVSHDLRTPLRSINGFSQALLEDYQQLLDDQGQDYLRRICQASSRMGTLIDDLLNLSRVTRAEIKYETVNLSTLAEKIIDEYRRLQPQRLVNVQIFPDMIDQGDYYLLGLVLENLINNAWKFTSLTPAALIEFGAQKVDRKTIYYVRDNGAGFDPQYLPKLFTPFQRLHRTEEFPGTGIGLATVKRIISRHGGRVWAEGQLNQGATFYFTLKEQSRWLS